MILRKYKTIIKDEIDRVLNENKYPKIEYQIKEIANPKFGQLYTNIPFILSRIIKKNPIDIANNIGKNIFISCLLLKWLLMFNLYTKIFEYLFKFVVIPLNGRNINN